MEILLDKIKIKDMYIFHERLSLDIHCLTNYIKNIKKQKHKRKIVSWLAMYVF